MRVTEFITHVRSYLNDPGGTRFKDDIDITSKGDIESRSMFEFACRLSDDYHNTILALRGGSAVNLGNGAWRWSMPTWVRRVTSVHKRTTTAASNTPTISAYQVVDPAGMTEQDIIEKTDVQRKLGWMWDGTYGFTLYGFSSPPDLVVRVAKTPPPMFAGKIATAYTGTDKGKAIVLPTASTMPGYRVPLEQGAYINAMVQLTEPKTASSLNIGLVRRCVFSNPMGLDGLTRIYRLDFQEAWAGDLEVDDVVETLLPWPDEYSQLLILRTVQAVIAAKFDEKVAGAISGPLAREWEQFKNGVAPGRDMSGPFVMGSGRGMPFKYDPNRVFASP